MTPVLVRSLGFFVIAATSACSLFVSLDDLASGGGTGLGPDSSDADGSAGDSALADSAPSDGSASMEGGSADSSADECSEPDLLAFYRFDEGAGTVATDCVTGNASNLVGGVTWVAGHHSSALQFNGSSGYLDVGAGVFAFDDVPFTVSVWMNIGSASGAFIVGKGVPGANTGWRLGLVTDTLTMRIGTGSSAVSAASGSEAALVGSWAHVAATYTPNGDTIVYVNGSAVATNMATPPLVDDGTSEARVAASSDGQLFYQGAVDDLRVYSRALSAAEVQALAEE